MNIDDLQKLRKEAKAKRAPLAMRSCWECNPAHAYLKNNQDSVIVCPHCGEYFYKGVKITE